MLYDDKQRLQIHRMLIMPKVRIYTGYTSASFCFDPRTAHTVDRSVPFLDIPP